MFTPKEIPRLQYYDTVKYAIQNEIENGFRWNAMIQNSDGFRLLVF